MRKELCLAEGVWSINRLTQQTAAIQSRRDTRFEALALRMLGTNTVNRFAGKICRNRSTFGLAEAIKHDLKGGV